MPNVAGTDRARALCPRRSDWAEARRAPVLNLIAGLTVAVVALPLALAFGVASGLGAQAGIATAVVAGALAAIFGGSNLQVSGPTGAMTVILLPIAHRYGADGVLMAGLMAGLVLIVLALARLGRFVRYLPIPVIEGFTAGIAVVIALQQVPAALGVEGVHDEKVWRAAWDAVEAFVQSPALAPVVISVGVAALMLVGARLRPGLPFSLLGITGAAVVVSVSGIEVDTLAALPSALPGPSLGFVDLGAAGALLPAALAIAALAALESLLSATVGDSMSVGHRTDTERELLGQGLANVAAPMFGGVPATGAIARTAVNVHAGATSRLSALVHAGALLLIVGVAGSLVSSIPVAALAGVLLATTVQMVESASLKALLRSTRGDAAVLVLTFVVTVVFDLVTAVAVGVALAVVVALRSVAGSVRLDEVPLDVADHSVEERALLEEEIVAFRLDGPLVFTAAHRFLLELSDIAPVRVVILRMSRVSTIDATGAHVLGDAITQLERRGIVVMLSGIAPDHSEVLGGLGVADHLVATGLVFPDTPHAIARARQLVADSVE